MGDEIVKVLDKLSEKFGVAIDWTQDNIVPYIQQLGEKIVKYELVTSWVWIGISLFVIALYCIIAKPLLKKNEEDCDDVEAVFILVGGIISIGFFVCIIFQIFDIVACYTFPEKIIFEYVQNLLTTAK